MIPVTVIIDKLVRHSCETAINLLIALLALVLLNDRQFKPGRWSIAHPIMISLISADLPSRYRKNVFDLYTNIVLKLALKEYLNREKVNILSESEEPQANNVYTYMVITRYRKYTY